MTNPTYHSRIDFWFVVSIIGSLAWCAYLAWSLRIEEPVGSGIAVFIGASLAFTYVYGLMPCKYTLENSAVKIQLGRTLQAIAYSEIKKITPETSFASSPALSLRRVRIEYRGGDVSISPRRREEFIAELHRRIDRAREQARSV